MAAPLAGATTSANWAGAYPYDHTVAGHNATGASALLVVATSAGAYSWDPKAYYAGVEMTLLARASSPGGQGTLWLFGLVGPASGVNAARVVRRSASDGGTSATSEYGDLGVTTVINLSGTHATSPFGAADADYGNASVATEVVTTVADGLLLGVAHNHYASPNPVTASGTTALFSNVTNANHGQFGFTRAAATAGTYGQTFATAFNSIGAALIAIQPAAGGGGGGTSYAMAAGAGAFALGGQAVSLKAQRKLQAQAHSLTLAGQAALFKIGRKVLAQAGGLALAGQAATLKTTRRLTGEPGSVTLAGQAATLKAGRRLHAGAGAFALGGQPVTLTRLGLNHYTLAADAGTYALSGQDAARKIGYRLGGGAGAFTLTGQAATLTHQALASYSLAAGAGAFTLAGQASLARRAYRLPGEPVLFTLQGQPAALRRTYRLAALAGTVTLTGKDVADPPADAPSGRVFTGNATSSFAQAASALKSGMPFSISLWFQTDDLAQVGAVLAFLGKGSVPTDYFALSVAGDKVRIEARTPAVNRAVDTTNAFTANTPHHVLGVFAASNDRRVYLDGDDASKGAGSGTATPAAADRFALGARRDSTPDGGFKGAIAHVAFWGAALGATEAAALRAGAWPPDVAPASLLAFYPLTGDDPETDLLGLGPSLALTGTTIGSFVPPVDIPEEGGENLPPVVDGEVTTETTIGSFYSWDDFPGSFDDLAAAKSWQAAGSSSCTVTTQRSLAFAPVRPKTIERLVARSLALADAAARISSKITLRGLSFAETVTDLVEWTNLVLESLNFAGLRGKTVTPAAHTDSFALTSAQHAETSKNVARALAFVETAAGEASYQRLHARSLSLAEASRRELTMTLHQALRLAELNAHNAGVILHDLVVQGQAMTLTNFRSFVTRGPLGFTAKEALVPGDYKYREAIVGVTVRAAATGGTAGILGLTLHVDVEDVRDRGEAILPALADQFIPFTKTFHAPPEVYTQTRAGAAPFYADITDVSPTGMTVTLRQVASPSTIVAGTITWSATGW